MHDLPDSIRDRVVADADVARTYGVDASPGAVAPEGFTVVRARDRADVVEVLTYAAAHRVPVVPQGARTATTGAAVALEGGIILNTESLDHVEIDPVERIAVVGPGVVNADLKSQLTAYDLAYPPDPASSGSSTIGGNIATNAGGLSCVKYGVTADYVRGLEVVLAGGEVLRTGRRTAKGVAGYDLTRLFVGSEGTLGVITEITLALRPAAEEALTLVAIFPTTAAAGAAVTAIATAGATPSLLELLDQVHLRAIEAYRPMGLRTDAR